MGRRRVLRGASIALLALPLGSTLLPAAAGAAPAALIGTFSITPGTCQGGVAGGTYLRMVLSGGSNAAGPYFSNSDSTCPDNTYTPLAPGSAHGLVTGSYQPEPSPAFDSSGNARAGEITTPVAFEGVKFATSTNPVDPQTGLAAPAPSIVADGASLSGNLEAFGVSWNNQQFNQGSPKPGGSTPGNTTPVTGNYDPTTGLYTLEWSSQVVGGPFNGFSAFWHLTGTFTASSGGASPSSGAATAPVTGANTAGATTGSPTASGASAGSTVGAGAGTSSSGAATTSTPPPSGVASKSTSADTPIALTSRTTSSGVAGWNTPTWLVVLLAGLAALGLAGVVWSERAIRRQGERT